MCTYNTISSIHVISKHKKGIRRNAIDFCKYVSQLCNIRKNNKRMTTIDISMYKQYSKNLIIGTGINQIYLYIL